MTKDKIWYGTLVVLVFVGSLYYLWPRNSSTLTPIPVEGVLVGQVLLGPTCPVERIPPDPQCAPRPYPTTVNVYSSGSNDTLASAKSDVNGNFRFDLAPGSYTVSAEGGKVLPRCTSESAEVNAQATTTITINCDTGIR